jgi:hypothetical protein
MVQSGRCLGFTLKAGECLRITGNFFRQELQGNKTMQPGIFRFVDHPHAPAAQLLDDAVVRDGLVDHELD